MAKVKQVSAPKIQESDLYSPVKALLVRQGFDVKGEVKGCDVVARRDDLLVAVELKLNLNLTLMLQANELAETVDSIYIAIPGTSTILKKQRKALFKLLRKLGFGLIAVNPAFNKAEAVLDPGTYTPRRLKKKRARLIKEFDELMGDPNTGGSSTQVRRITAYRQKAVHIARFLEAAGASQAKNVRDALKIENARDIMYQNHYGWFVGLGKGFYTLSERGQRELSDWSDVAGG